MKTNAAAIGFTVASAACFTAIDALVKYLSLRYPAPLLVWARWAVPALLLVVLLGPKLRWNLLRSGNARLQWIRGTVLLLSSVCSFVALRFLPLADATGLNYSTPIFVTILAGLVLHERVPRSRWLFVAAGFAGTLLVAQPGHAAPVVWLLAFGAATLNAVFQILTRKLAAEDLSTLIFYPTLVGSLIALPAAVPFFAAPWRMLDVALFTAMGCLGLLGHFLFVQAFKRARAVTIAPFTYVQLLWSALAGWAVFGTLPNHLGLAGMVLIVVSGVAAVLTERGSAPAGVQYPMLFVPLGTLAETRVELSAASIGIGQSMLIHDGKGSPKIVIRTD